MMTRKTSRSWAAVLALAVALPLSAGAALLADGKITGKVVNEDGSVAAGVPVRVMEAPARGPGGPGRAGGAGGRATQPAPGDRPGGGGPGRMRQPVAETETGQDGTFTVSLPAGDYVVVAGRRGENMGRARVTVEEGKTVTVDLKLAPAGPGRGNWGTPRPPAN